MLRLYFCLVCFSEIKSCNAQVFLRIFSREFLLSLLGAKTAGWDHFTIVTSEVFQLSKTTLLRHGEDSLEPLMCLEQFISKHDAQVNTHRRLPFPNSFIPMAYSLNLPFANFVEENYLPLCGLFSQGYSLAGEFPNYLNI